MTELPPPRDRLVYLIRITGHLDAHWSSWFGGFAVTRERDGTTSLAGTVADQAELHGLLVKVRDLGVTLLSVAVTPRTHA